MQAKLKSGGHFLPLPKEPAALANVLEVSPIEFLLQELTAVKNASVQRGTERGYPDIEIDGPTFGNAPHAIEIKAARRKVGKNGRASKNSACFVMNRLTQGAIRKLKDGQGNYLWQPAFGAGAPPTLLGFPVTECEEMPDIAAGSFALAFGDFKQDCLVVVLRDLFAAKPYVLFYTTKRVGGGVQDFDAIKVMKFAVS